MSYYQNMKNDAKQFKASVIGYYCLKFGDDLLIPLCQIDHVWNRESVDSRDESDFNIDDFPTSIKTVGGEVYYVGETVEKIQEMIEEVLTLAK